jgi:hypothetical protein
MGELAAENVEELSQQTLQKNTENETVSIVYLWAVIVCSTLEHGKWRM